MEDSPVLNSAKRKDLEDIALEDGAGSHKRLKRQLTQESDLKVREFLLCLQLAAQLSVSVCTLQSTGPGRRSVELRRPAPHAGHCRGLY